MRVFLIYRRFYRSNRRAIRGAAACCALLLAAIFPTQISLGQQVVEQAEQGGDARILHEYFDPWGVDIAELSGSRRGKDASEASSSADSADSTDSSSAAGQPPGLSLNQDDDEVVFGESGPVDPGQTSTPWGPLEPGASSSRLDDATDRVDELKYWANFEPSVVPYKRVVVQNHVSEVDGTYSMSLQAGRFSPVALDPRPANAGEDVFWGSFLVRTNAGKRHPIPSVAPQQRILKLEVAPTATVQVVRDEADNFYIVPDTDEFLRINMQIAVPRAYFSADLRQNIGWGAFSGALAARNTVLSAPVRRVAAEVLKMSGASRQMSPRDALWALIEYYRDFEARPFPEEHRGEDLYMSISRQQIGVCRHRSLAFVVSARALGVPARYVYNEAHAFVEVWWPGSGWRRIDLGGAADEVDFSGRGDASIHQAGEDPLPHPPNYMSELERIAGSVPGADRALSDARRGADSQDQDEVLADGLDDGADEHGDHLADQQEAGVDEDGAQPMSSDADELAQEEAGEGESVEQFEASGQLASPSAEDQRKPVRIDAVASAEEVFLGDQLNLSGSVFTAAGRPVGRAGLQVYLGAPGAESVDGLQLLGTMETDAGGRFEGDFRLPDDISIGRWRLIIRYDGDKEHQPAQVN